jgi:uncharacterized membrane protein
MNTFSTKEALAFGWKITKENFWFLAGLCVIIFVVNYLPAVIVQVLGIKDSFGETIVSIVGWVVAAFFQVGILKITLELVDGRKPSYSLLVNQKQFLVTYLVATILVGLAVTVGMILLIVPGVMIGLAFMLYSYFIVDKGAGITQSIRLSIEATKGHRWQLFGFALLCGLLNTVGFFLIAVGLFFTVPTTMLAYAYVYRKLAKPDELVVAAPTAPVVASTPA